MLDRTQALVKLDLPALTPWMETKAPETRYDYSDSHVCPCACFLRDRYQLWDAEVIPGLATWTGGSAEIPPEVDFVLCGMPRTYGAAVDRARALAKS